MYIGFNEFLLVSLTFSWGQNVPYFLVVSMLDDFLVCELIFLKEQFLDDFLARGLLLRVQFG